MSNLLIIFYGEKDVNIGKMRDINIKNEKVVKIHFSTFLINSYIFLILLVIKLIYFSLTRI
jgi:hypothetical protein